MNHRLEKQPERLSLIICDTKLQRETNQQFTGNWLCLLKYILSGINAIMFYKIDDLLTFLCCESITMKSYRSFASTAVILYNQTYCQITKLD